MTEEYINKTKEAVNFLTHIHSEDTTLVASILSYQADGNTEMLIKLLHVEGLYIDELIQDLKKI